jgi:hypothetical protein
MSVHYSPIPNVTGNNSNIVTVPANASPVLVPANPNRLGGYIENKANKSMWVKFGDPNTPPLLAATRPLTEVPGGANVDIPDDFTGVIGLIWSNGFANGVNAIAIVTEILP